MKKFLVLFLLVSLVPFTVGCRLFDKGDDDHAAAPAVLKLSLPVLVPADIFAPSIRASTPTPIGLSLADLRLTIEGIDMKPSSTPPESVDGRLRVIFESIDNVLKTKVEAIRDSTVPLTAELKYVAPDGNKVDVDDVKFATDELRKIDVKTGVAKDIKAKTTKTKAAIEADLTEALKVKGYTVVSYSVIAVTDSNGNDISLTASGALSVYADEDGKIAITVETNEAVTTATPTFVIKVSNTKNPAGSVTIDTSNKTQTFVDVVTTEDKKKSVFTFDADAKYASGRKLTAGETYKIEFVSTTAKYKAGTETDINLTIPEARYITIGE